VIHAVHTATTEVDRRNEYDYAADRARVS